MRRLEHYSLFLLPYSRWQIPSTGLQYSTCEYKCSICALTKLELFQKFQLYPCWRQLRARHDGLAWNCRTCIHGQGPPKLDGKGNKNLVK